MLRDYRVEFAGVEFNCVDAGFGENEDVEVVIRPEDIKIVSPDEAPIVGVVESIIFKGVHNEIKIGAHGSKWTIHTTRSEEEGTRIGMNILPDDIHIMRKS
jgi:spermidine/putrescine transport system ATP-binding protein